MADPLLIDGDEIRAALAPLRPDPAAFRAGVLAVLRERDADSTRRAAALLPPLLPLGALPKHPLALLSLPAVTTGMLALGALAGLRAVLAPHRAGVEDPERLDAQVRAWWREHARVAVPTLTLLLVLAAWRPVDAAGLLLAASLLHVSSVLGRLGRAGLATRRGVGAFCAGFLGLLLLAGLLLEDRLGPAPRSPLLPHATGPWLLLAGTLTCGLLADRSGAPWRALATLRALLTLALLLWSGWALLLAPPPGDVARRVAFVERFEAPLDRTVAWRDAGLVGRGLAREGVPFDARRARERLAGLAEARPADGPLLRGTESWSVASAARLGAVPGPVRERLARDAARQEPGPGTGPAELRALLAGADGTLRGEVAARLLAAWRSPEAVHDLRHLVDLLELLERADSAPPADLLVEARRILGEHLVRRADGTQAFAQDLGPSALLGPAPTRPAVHLVAPTLEALEVATRCGLPPAADPRAIERFLLEAATPGFVERLAPPSLPLLTVQPHRHVAATALVLLRELARPAPRRPHLLALLLQERLALGCALLSALCLVATLRCRPARS